MAEIEVSREYAKLKKRGFKPYSEGHRIMYDFPLQLLRRVRRSERPLDILEIGFGIGYGLDAMVEGKVIRDYIGYDPDQGSFDYVSNRYKDDTKIHLYHRPFEYDPSMRCHADHAFCIEVIEHVPPGAHLQFLVDISKCMKDRGTLWLSTPCEVRVPEHGVRPEHEWVDLIKKAGFKNCTVHRDQWTNLYICQLGAA